tara:strand:+ start:593 stop:745 length:153 start_codon:yes stop_codon:yes gene_type:complete
MSSEIIGNWVGSVLILKSSGPDFFLVMGGSMFFPILGFLFMKKPVIHDQL